MYEVAVCQTQEWDWQMAIYFGFKTFEEMIDFVRICLDQEKLIQIQTIKDGE